MASALYGLSGLRLLSKSRSGSGLIAIPMPDLTITNMPYSKALSCKKEA
jgi:hypothetical protein